MRDKDFDMSKAVPQDVSAIAQLYNDLHDALEQNINYPGWIRDIYPTEVTAVEGIDSETLYIMKIRDQIAGSVILNHIQPEAYSKLLWNISAEEEKVLVVHTLAIHPYYFRKGVAKELLYFAEQVAKDKGAKTIRLDVSVHNLPAIGLYQTCGYTFVGEVDLGLNIPGLEWFQCYDKKVV